MVAQRMGSQSIGSNSTMGNQTQDPKPNPLSRQGSLYNLTLDEVQTQLGDLGKPVSSMNLDELLKRVFTAEENNQTVGDVNTVPTSNQPGPAPSGLNRQSSLTFAGDLSKKTVDEVWHDIQQDQERSSIDRKATLGEITLEDFLVKAGVVAESAPGPRKKGSGSVLGGVDSMGLTPQTQWMNYQIPQIPVYAQGHPVQHPIPLCGNTMMDATYSENLMSLSSMGTLSDTQTPGRKRVASGEIVEKSVERRQKRMIKNRESAARSRARKQAYTHELENKVSRLEEENEKLKRQKELEQTLPYIPPPQPKYQLRRTSSAPV